MSIDWDSEVKGPQDALLDLPQERITGDILRGRGPRRGNLERLIKYWRPIMRKPGGFRRCLVILANHPELYPLERICAWLHHETTGLWPNEGNHHEGGKLGPIVGRARRYLKKPKKRKRRGRKDLGESEFYDYEYSFKDVVSQSRVCNGLMVQPINRRQNVIDYKASMFMDRLEDISERKEEIQLKRVGIVGSSSASGQALQAVGSILLPGDISAFRSPVRSQIYETLTPGGGRGVGRGLRRVVRGAGRGARNKFRCPPGFQKGGTFTNKFYSTCGAQILGIPSFGPGAFSAGIERALARLARDASLVRSIGDLKNNSNPYAVIRAAQIPFAPKKTNPTRRQTSVDLILARIANGETVPTRFVRRDGVILEPLVSFEDLGKLDEFDDMVDGSLITLYEDNNGFLGAGSLGTFGTGLRDNYINIEDEGIVKVSRVGGELDQGVRDRTNRVFNASIAKAQKSRNPDRTAPLMDFIEASDGKFSVEFGEIKNNKFVADNTSKNELVQVRSGNITKLVPKWVYDTFLSRSAPRRIDSDPIYEIVEGDAKSIPFFHSQKTRKEDIRLARDYFNLVNEKTARFVSTAENAEFEVKAPRLGRRLTRGAGRGAMRGIRGTASAVFDSDLGRYRCPPGTRYGGTFTDRLGTNCGYSLPANVVNNLGKASEAAKSIVRGIRVSNAKRKNYKNAASRLKNLNESLEKVLDLTESRAGTRLGSTIAQRRAISGLNKSQQDLFSGLTTRTTLAGLKNQINDAMEKGDRRSINNIWDELSKLANLEAGRLTANSDTSQNAIFSAETIQDQLGEFAQKLIDRADLGNQGRSAVRRRERRGFDTVDTLPLKPVTNVRKERFEALRSALSRGRRMKKSGDPIPELIPSAFYNDDGTINKEKITSARRAVGLNLRAAKSSIQKTIGSNERDINKLDEAAMKFLMDKTVADGERLPLEDLQLPRHINTLRELRATMLMDDQEFAEKFDDSIRRLGRTVKNGIVEEMGIDAREAPTMSPRDENLMRGIGIPEARRSRSAFVQGVKQRAADKKDGLRARLDKRLFREYAGKNTVDTAVQDTMLENPDLPESLTEIATVPWESYGKILDFKQQRDLNAYVAMSELPDAALLDIYERTGIVVAPRGQYDFTEDVDIFAEEILGVPQGQNDIPDVDVAQQNFTKWVNNAMGNTDYGVTPTEDSIGAIPVAVGQVRDTNTGEVFDVVAEVVFDPEEGDVVVSDFKDDPIALDTELLMQLRKNDGTIIYQTRGVGEGRDYRQNSLAMEFDLEEKSAYIAEIGVNNTVPDTFDEFEVVGDPINFKGGNFANTVVNERLVPFLRGAGFENIRIGGTGGTGAGTWVRYGFTERAGTTAAPPALYKRMVSGKNQVITGNLVKDADSALNKLNNGQDLTPDEVIAMAIVGTPESLEDIRAIDRVLENSPNDAPGAYEIYSMLVGVNDDGSLKRNTPLYRAMIGSDYGLKDSEIDEMNAAIDRAFESFGVTKPETATGIQTRRESSTLAAIYGESKGVDLLAGEGLELNISGRSIQPQTDSLWGTPAEGGVAVSTALRSLPTELQQQNIDSALRKIAGARERDAYGKVVSRLGKRHFAIVTGEERARYASEIERTLDRLSREGILNEDDPELNELVGLAAALRDTTNFPEEIGPNRGLSLDDISVDLGDVDTIDNLIDDVKFLIAETDTPADLEKLLQILEDTKADEGGRAASRAVEKASNFSDSKVVTGLNALKENFKNKRFRRNPFTLDEADRNKRIAETLTLWDELLRQTDRDADDPRRGIDAIMGQVVDIAEAENMTPEEVIQRSLAHTLMETNYWPESELTSGKSSFELWGLKDSDDPDFIPASSMTFNQKQVDDLRVTNNVMQTVLLSIANGPDEPYEALNDPDIMETGTVIGAVNPDGTLVTKEQAREMLVATAKLDERLKAAIDPKGKPNDPATVVLADTEEDLEQLIKTYDLSSNVPSDDYIFNRVNNFGNVLDETRERRGMPYGKDMISSAVINDMTDPDYVPRKKEIDDWRFASKGMDLNPELDDQVYDLKQQGLTDKEVAERLNIPEFDVGPRAAQSQKNKPEDIDARNTAKNTRRTDIFDSDQEEVEEEALFGDDEDDVFDLERVVDPSRGRRPLGDGDDTDSPPLGDDDTLPPEYDAMKLDEFLTGIEDYGDRLEMRLRGLAMRDYGFDPGMSEKLRQRLLNDPDFARRNRMRGSGPRPSDGRRRPTSGRPRPDFDSRGPRPDSEPRRPRPDDATEESYTPPAGLGDREYTREEYDAMSVDDLLYLTSGERWENGELDPRALRALRRRVREMDDDELRRYAEGRDFVPDTGYALVGQNVINEEARRRGLIDSPDFMDLSDFPTSADGADRPSSPDRRGRASGPARRSRTVFPLVDRLEEGIDEEGFGERREVSDYRGREIDDLSIDELIDKINFDPMPETRGANLALRRRTATLTDSEFEDLVNRVRAAQAENPVRTGIGGSGNRALDDLERILNIRNRAGGVPDDTPRFSRTERISPVTSPDRRGRPTGPPSGISNIDVDQDAPDFQREVWRLRTEEGLSLEEVAERFDTDRGVIRNAEVNYARSLSTEDRQAASLRADRAALARDRARLGTDNARMSEAELLDTFGERIWDLRTRQGLTLEETADVLGLDRSQVRRTEVSYGRDLPSAVRERDYARGREAAMLRQDVDLMDIGDVDMGDDLDDLPSDPAPQTPTDIAPKEVFDALVVGGDLPDGVANLNKADRFKKLNDHFNELDSTEAITEALQALGGPNSPNLDSPHEDALIAALDASNGDIRSPEVEAVSTEFGIDFNDSYLRYMAIPQIREARKQYLDNRRNSTEGDVTDPSTTAEAIEETSTDLGRLVRTGTDAMVKNEDNKPLMLTSSFGGTQQFVVRLGQDSFPDFLTSVQAGKLKDGVFGKLKNNGHEVFVTGRTVRDILTGKRPDVYQIRTSASLEQIARALGFEWNDGVPEMDGSFRRIDTGSGVNLELIPDAEGQTVLRYTSQGGDIAEISQLKGDSIDDDLELRDLSINSIALGVEKSAGDTNWGFIVYDPADGLKDLGVKYRRVKPSDPDGRKLFKKKKTDPDTDILVREGVFKGYDGDPDIEITPESTAALTEEKDVVFKKPVIRSLGNPDERIEDDPLIALRLVRRAEADGADLSPDIEKAIRVAAIDEVEPFLLRDELNKAIGDARSTRALFNRLDELGLLEKMFPNLNIDRATMGKVRSGNRSPAPHLAQLLRGNDTGDVIDGLRRLGYSEDTIRAVTALQDMDGMTPETAPRVAEGLRDAMNNGEITSADIVSHSDVVGLDAPSAHALADITDMDPSLEDVSPETYKLKLELHGNKDYVTDRSPIGNILTRALAEGGATLDVSTQNDVTSGWAVSKDKNGFIIKSGKLGKILSKPAGARSAGEKKELDSAIAAIWKMIAKNKAEFGEGEEGIKVALGLWRKRARKKDSKGQIVEVDELHVDITNVLDKDRYDENAAIDMARQENQEGIMDLAQLDETGDADDAYTYVGGSPTYLEVDDPSFTAFDEDWKAAKAAKAKQQKEETKTNLDSVADLLEQDSKSVISQLRRAADPNDSFKYQKGVQQDIRSVEDEIEKLENMKANFARSYPDGADKERILAAFDDIIGNKRSGEAPELRPQRRDPAEVDADTPEAVQPVAAPRREVVVPDPIDAEMDDVEFEQAINNLRDPIRDSALVDTEGKAIVDEAGTPTFDLGFDKEEFDKANKKVKGVTDKLVNDLIEDLNIPLQGVDELLEEDGTLRPDLDKDEMKDIRSARASRRVAVKKALQNAANKIKINNLPDEEQIEEIVEQGNQAVEDLTDGDE
jgi:transcriptional regulator with XRE-family HTH domain